MTTQTTKPQDTHPTKTAFKWSWIVWVRIAVVVIIVVAFIATVRLLPVANMIAWLSTAVQDMGIWGPLVFAVIYMIATAFMLPSVPLTLAAGAVFGLFWGTVAVSVGSTCGAALAFLISRYLARSTIERYLKRFPKFKAIDSAVSKGGWKIVAMLRLSPGVPFNIQNYLYGLTAIRFWPCMFTSWLTMLPGTFVYVYLGYAGKTGVAEMAGKAADRSPWQWTLLGVGLLATIGLMVYITKLARRAIEREAGDVDDVEASQQDKQDDNATRADHKPIAGLQEEVT